MASDEAFGERLGQRFGVRDVPVLLTKTLHKTQVAITLIQSEAAIPVMSEPLPAEDAFLVHFNIRACPDHELWVGDRAIGKCTFGEGETAIHDLKQPPRALVSTPMGSMMFYLSRTLLNELCDNSNVPRIEDLYLRPGTSSNDPTVRHLSDALRAAMSKPEQAPPLFIDYVTFALAAHVAETYGGMLKPRIPQAGGLSRWQELRAKEMLADNLDGNVSLEALARECGVSIGHFTRSFRRTVGEPPHRWMIRQRVERAKMLLRDSRLSLAEVAVASGFCDQSHLTRCLRNVLGVSPGALRKNVIKTFSTAGNELC